MCTLCQAMNPTLGLTTHSEWSEPDFANAPGTPVVGPLNATYTEGADAAANSTTAYSLSDDDVFSGSIDFMGDDDWIEITLVNGAHLTVVQDNVSLGPADTFLTLVDASGSQIYTNPISGGTETYFDSDESTIVYYNNSGTTQTVYVVASSFSGNTGDYTVTAQIQEYGQGSYDEIVEYLTTGWIGTQMAFDVSPGGTITYDITDLDADEQILAVTAMEAWTNVTGINFAASAGGTAEITFVNDVNGNSAGLAAFAGPTAINNNVIETASVTVTSGWVDNYGTDLDSYSFQTYMHEIGHAMGLTHGGPYDGSATYSTAAGGDNIFTNDSTQYTIMSYFDPYETTGSPFEPYNLLTPMMVDILAMQELYGVAGNIRSGNTVYGDGSTAGGYYDMLLDIGPYAAFTLIDDGGVDTINLGSISVDITLDLTPGAFSSIGLGTNNFAIFETTVLENYIGGSGSDDITGNLVTNVFQGGAGNDTLYGEAGDDTIYGGTGNDAISGGGDNDTLVGGSGNDFIVGEDGDDSILGSSGIDTLFGSAGDDIVIGSYGADDLHGEGDNDSVYGGGGNDLVSGGFGNDFLDGGANYDTLFGGSGNDSLFGAAGNDIFYGGDDNDTIDGGAGADTIFGEDGEDILYGNGRSDQIYGGIGHDTIYGDGAIDGLYGNDGDDFIYGGAQRDSIYGGADNDTLFGGGGNDTLFGGAGNDELSGEGGTDILNGSEGNDDLTGGAGADTFVFEAVGGLQGAVGLDTIQDFQNNIDTIQLDEGLWGGGFTVQEVLNNFATETGTDVILDFGFGNVIAIEGLVTANALLDDITLI